MKRFVAINVVLALSPLEDSKQHPMNGFIWKLLNYFDKFRVNDIIFLSSSNLII